MEHCQIAAKNATARDVARRFINNGVCVPYRIYVVEGGGPARLLGNMLLACLRAAVWSGCLAASAVIPNRTLRYEALFRFAHHAAQVVYTFRIFFSKDFRAALTRDYWS
jgi:hypothetical protein